METTKTKDLKIAFLLDEKKMRELDSILKKVSEKITYDVYCIDGTSIKFESLEELLKYPNRKEKQFERIEAHSPWGDPEMVSVTFRNSEFNPLSYRVSGEEKNVDFNSREIEGYFHSLKQWFSPLSSMNKISFIFGIFLVVVTGLVLSYFNLENLGLYIIISVTTMYIYDKIRGYLFPPASFKLRDGIERVKMRTTVRNIVLGAIGLTAIVSFLVNQIPPIFGK